MNWHLEEFERWTERMLSLEEQIIARGKGIEEVELLRTIPGVGYYSALALACRVGEPSRFPKGKSLAHYWGLTPGVNDSGEGTGRRGRITKAGSTVAHWMLAQITLHVLRRDPVMKAWYKPIKNRRGSKIARVAVMRRLAVIIRNMLVNKQDYLACRDAMIERRKKQLAKKKAA
jgi:transposase